MDGGEDTEVRTLEELARDSCQLTMGGAISADHDRMDALRARKRV